AMGSETILRHCEDRLGIHPGERTKDGQFSLEEVACLASCGTAPAAILNNFTYVENVTPESIDALIARLRTEPGQPMAPGPEPQQIVDEVVKSNLRGRGGAGFPAGMKWNFVRKETSFPKYLVVNADEGEPGTFKDRAVLENSPHMFVEGLVIGCYALDCHLTYVYCRGEFRRGPVARLQQA